MGNAVNAKDVEAARVLREKWNVITALGIFVGLNQCLVKFTFRLPACVQ